MSTTVAMLLGIILAVQTTPGALAGTCGVAPTPTPNPSGQLFCELPLDSDGSDRVGGTVDPYQSLTTDGARDGATPDDPVETQVNVPNGGPLSIEETVPSLAPPPGYSIIGQQVNISAPEGGVPPNASALLMFFSLDGSILPPVDASVVKVVKDGGFLSSCDNNQNQASPDPCVYDANVYDGDLHLSVWSNHGGSWIFVAPAPAGGNVTAEATTGVPVTTDSAGAGATASNPVQTSVVTSTSGPVSISEQWLSTAPPSGYSFVGVQVAISAPPGSVASPLRFTFTVDATVLGGKDETTLQVFRDGVAIADCSPKDGSASPDPCVSDRTMSSGDVVITVLSSHASRWNVGIRKTFAFSGFFQPVDNPGTDALHPVFNSVKAGSAVPVKFSLNGDQGLVVLASGSPSSKSIACQTGVTIDPIEEVTPATASGLRYDVASGQYIYTWKTVKAWAGTCRQLAVRLADGTVHIADFKLSK